MFFIFVFLILLLLYYLPVICFFFSLYFYIFSLSNIYHLIFHLYHSPPIIYLSYVAYFLIYSLPPIPFTFPAPVCWDKLTVSFPQQRKWWQWRYGGKTVNLYLFCCILTCLDYCNFDFYYLEFFLIILGTFFFFFCF